MLWVTKKQESKPKQPQCRQAEMCFLPKAAKGVNTHKRCEQRNCFHTRGSGIFWVFFSTLLLWSWFCCCNVNCNVNGISTICENGNTGLPWGLWSSVIHYPPDLCFRTQSANMNALEIRELQNTTLQKRTPEPWRGRMCCNCTTYLSFPQSDFN